MYNVEEKKTIYWFSQNSKWLDECEGRDFLNLDSLLFSIS